MAETGKVKYLNRYSNEKSCRPHFKCSDPLISHYLRGDGGNDSLDGGIGHDTLLGDSTEIDGNLQWSKAA